MFKKAQYQGRALARPGFFFGVAGNRTQHVAESLGPIPYAQELAFARRETKFLQFTAMSGTKTARNVIIMTSIAKVASL